MRRYVIFAVCLFVVSCATTRDAGEACDVYVADEVAEVFREYEAYRDNGFQEGLIGRARGALERARQASQGEPMLSEVPVCPRQHQRQQSWKELREDIQSAEALVAELEEARGVRFVAIESGRLVWVDRTTGKPIPPDIADSI